MNYDQVREYHKQARRDLERALEDGDEAGIRRSELELDDLERQLRDLEGRGDG